MTQFDRDDPKAADIEGRCIDIGKDQSRTNVLISELDGKIGLAEKIGQMTRR